MHALLGGRRKAAAVALVVSTLLALGLTGVGRAGAAEERLGRRQFMLALTNEDRVQRDRDRLAFANALSRYAKEHSEAMARRGYIFHSSEAQLRDVLDGYHWSIAGENVGVGSSLESLEDAFMASKLHRQNILRPAYEHAAIGVVRDGDRLFVTVIFYG